MAATASTVLACAAAAAAALLALSGGGSRSARGTRAGRLGSRHTTLLTNATPATTAAGGGGRRLHLLAAVATGVSVAVLLPGALGWGTAVLAAAVVWRRSATWEGRAQRRRRVAVAAEVPQVVDLLVAALSAGSAPGTGLARVTDVLGGPAADVLRPWVSRLQLGADPASVWAEMSRDPAFGRLGTALLRSAESGAPVAEALTRLATDLRSRRRTEVESRVRQVEVRAAVPLGLCLLPAFVLLGVVPLVAGAVAGLLP